MKTKLLTVTAFSLLMAAGMATAQSTSDSQIESSPGTGTTGSPSANSPAVGADGNPLQNQAIDPNVTNSTTGEGLDDTCKLPDGTTSTMLERGPDGNCVQ